MKNEDLIKLHSALLVILDEIDRICRKYNINYFLDSGTALGAIRHSGFIPWDDDADIGFLREDYNKFLEVAENELGSNFYLQTHEKDPDYIKFNAKIRLNGTFFPEVSDEGKNLHRGIFVDLFPFDYTGKDEKTAKKNTKKMRLIYKLWSFPQNRLTTDSKIQKILRKIVGIIPETYLIRKYNALYSRYSSCDNSNLLTCYSYKMNDDHYLYFKQSMLDGVIDVFFEGRTYRIMQGYDEYLKIMFGDYMSLPHIEKRISHYDGTIEFGQFQ